MKTLKLQTNLLLCAFLILGFAILTPSAYAQLTLTSTATLNYTGGTPDVNNLNGKEATMEIVWAENTTWVTFSNLMQAISISTTFTVDGQQAVFPASNELPLILNIVNSVDDRLAYSDINENVIVNFDLFGQTSSTRSLIHPDATPLSVANGATLEISHLDRGFNLLDGDGFFRELIVGSATYSYANISNTVTGPLLLGDVNLDGAVNLMDIAPFIAHINNGTFQTEADLNEDNMVNLLDIEPFVAAMNN